MASAAQSVATIELLVKGATGGGAAAAPGAGAGGKPPKRTPAELKKFQRDKMASQQRAPGGAVQRALHKVGGAKPGSVQKEGASRHPMMGIAKESLKQGNKMANVGRMSGKDNKIFKNPMKMGDWLEKKFKLKNAFD